MLVTKGFGSNNLIITQGMTDSILIKKLIFLTRIYRKVVFE